MTAKMISTAAAVLALVIVSPGMAKTDCNNDIREFDAAVKITTAKKADVQKAMRLRNEARKDCQEKGGTPVGDADMRQALTLIGAK
ncbi:hypothetical protein [Rhizobium sp. RAF56]|uniref:hypothetical protein n=1 Tax=Rhizobium sp. RAF56 TaxID=3233062 RepID=UPI003F9826EE